MTLRELREKRAKVEDAMRVLANQNQELTPEQVQQFDTLKAERAGYQSQIERAELVDEFDRRSAGTPINGRTDDFGKACKDFSLQKMLARAIDPHYTDAGREVEVSQELAKRAGKPGSLMIPLEAMAPKTEQRVVTAAGAGASLIQETVMASEFIDALRAQSIVASLGARTITGLQANVALPRLDAGNPAAQWIADNAALTSQDNSFSQVTMSPKTLGLLTEVSRLAIIQTNPSIENIIRSDMSAKIALAVDLAALAGTGASNQPTGITHAGVGSTTSGGAAPTLAKSIAPVTAVKAANVPEASYGWAMGVYEEAILKQTPKIGSTFPEFLIDSDEPANTMGGYRYAVSSQIGGSPLTSPVTNGLAIFGAWNQLLLGFWSSVEILVNPFSETPFSKGNVQVRALVNCDIAIRHLEAFNVWSGFALS